MARAGDRVGGAGHRAPLHGEPQRAGLPAPVRRGAVRRLVLEGAAPRLELGLRGLSRVPPRRSTSARSSAYPDGLELLGGASPYRPDRQRKVEPGDAPHAETGAEGAPGEDAGRDQPEAALARHQGELELVGVGLDGDAQREVGGEQGPLQERPRRAAFRIEDPADVAEARRVQGAGGPRRAATTTRRSWPRRVAPRPAGGRSESGSSTMAPSRARARTRSIRSRLQPVARESETRGNARRT